MFEQIITIIMLSVALAMDAFAVSISLGTSGVAKRFTEQSLIGLTFGFFQGGLFLLGYFASIFLAKQLSTYNSIVAGVLLSFLGLKMLKEAFSKVEKRCEHENCHHCRKDRCLNTGDYRFLSLKILLIYGTATSIDAFAAGISYGLKNQYFILATILITIITILFSFFGAMMGYHIKKYVGKKAMILGGFILLFLAIKSFL